MNWLCDYIYQDFYGYLEQLRRRYVQEVIFFQRVVKKVTNTRLKDTLQVGEVNSMRDY